MIVPGKTTRSQPKLSPNLQGKCFILSSGSTNHFANKQLTRQYIEFHLHPIRLKIVESNNLDENQIFIILLDHFSGQDDCTMFDFFLSFGYLPIFIPAGWTGKLQPLDISVFAGLKQRFRNKFCNWYSEEINSILTKQKKRQKEIEELQRAAQETGQNFDDSQIPKIPVLPDLRTSSLRDRQARWVIESYYETPKETIIAGFNRALTPYHLGESQSISDTTSFYAVDGSQTTIDVDDLSGYYSDPDSSISSVPNPNSVQDFEEVPEIEVGPEVINID